MYLRPCCQRPLFHHMVGSRTLAWSTYLGMASSWICDNSWWCRWRAITDKFMVVVLNSIVIPQGALGSNVGGIAVAKSQTWVNACRNKRIHLCVILRGGGLQEMASVIVEGRSALGWESFRRGAVHIVSISSWCEYLKFVINWLHWKTRRIWAVRTDLGCPCSMFLIGAMLNSLLSCPQCVLSTIWI